MIWPDSLLSIAVLLHHGKNKSLSCLAEIVFSISALICVRSIVFDIFAQILSE